MRIKGGTHSRRINLGSPPQYMNYLLDTLRFCAGVIVAVALKQVDDTPDAETSAEGDNEGLKNGDCLFKKCHIVC